MYTLQIDIDYFNNKHFNTVKETLTKTQSTFHSATLAAII